MQSLTDSWLFWAILAAVFAAMTVVFAKVGISEIDSDLATLIRTVVIVIVLAGTVAALGKFQPLGTIPGKTWVFLVLSGLATGASWIAYYRALKLGQASQVAPIDKLSVVLVAIFGVLFLGETLKPMGWVGVALVGAGAVVLAVSG